ncbi:hypothetical protein [Halobaculum lipolyticum]|uniref:HPP family protein n=1 Tax=Halobaculum lipolyticum TaxID=3032001 RepID=A0ABD5W5G2_9EURY|nr:hypothetical protein [Halobaculum sp. DT31]
MSHQLPEEWVVRDARVNAGIAWTVTAVLALVAVVAVLDGLLAMAAVAAVATFVAVVPPLVARAWTHTVSWPLLLVASVPLAVGTGRPGFLGDVVVGVSVATLALLVVVALQLVTSVRMTPGFAVVFVVIATLATAGFWAVGSAASAVLFGTRFLETNDELMAVFTAAAVAGVGAGLLFRWYFRRLLVRDGEATAEEPEVAA